VASDKAPKSANAKRSYPRSFATLSDTPSEEEQVPWKCRRLVIGTGTGALPLMDEVKQEAKRPQN
jgi:hypothetical protein